MFLLKNSALESIFLIDHQGKQVGNIHVQAQHNLFYKLPKAGYDYSSRQYFLSTRVASSGVTLTEPHISLISGALCMTYAQKVTVYNKDFILCVNYFCDEKLQIN